MGETNQRGESRKTFGVQWGPVSWGEGVSLALVGHTSRDGITIKMPYGADVLNQRALHLIFSYWVG